MVDGEPATPEHHNRRVEGRRLSWRVDRPRELAAGLPSRPVAVASIREFDEEFRPACRAVAEHARRIAAAALDDPILLTADGRVIDGMHRIAKAVMAGIATVPAITI